MGQQGKPTSNTNRIFILNTYLATCLKNGECKMKSLVNITNFTQPTIRKVLTDAKSGYISNCGAYIGPTTITSNGNAIPLNNVIIEDNNFYKTAMENLDKIKRNSNT